MEPQAAALLAPYLEVVRSANPDGGLTRYPGSPAIARRLMRKQDRLTAIELHPDDFVALKSTFAGDFQARILQLDGWLALGGHLPPKEKRGLVLVDPPFEQGGEFDRLEAGLKTAWRRWPGGIYALWYPIKDRAAAFEFRRSLRISGIPKILDIVLEVRPASREPRLDGSGLIVVNPPFTFEGQMKTILTALKRVLGDGQNATFALEWLTREAAPQAAEDR